MVFGFDSALGASFLVYMLVQTLSQFAFIPIVGDRAAQSIQKIESNRKPRFHSQIASVIPNPHNILGGQLQGQYVFLGRNFQRVDAKRSGGHDRQR